MHDEQPWVPCEHTQLKVTVLQMPSGSFPQNIHALHNGSVWFCCAGQQLTNR